MRDTTERPEAVTAGTVELVGTDKNLIINKVQNLLDNKELYKQMSEAANPYGDGKACETIISVLKTQLVNEQEIIREFEVIKN